MSELSEYSCLLNMFKLRPVALIVLQQEFSVQPSDVEVAEGEVAVLNCGPPTGRPEANVLWKKDGVPVNVTDPHFTVSTRGSKVNLVLFHPLKSVLFILL